MLTGQDGEDGLLAGLYLLVEYIVGLIELGQSGGAIDHGDGINMVELVLTIVDDGT